MSTVYYKKVGRRYVPVSAHDDMLDAMPIGSHLVIINENGGSRRYRIDPAFCALIAAGYYAEDAMISAVHEASSLRPIRVPVTQEQQDAWARLEEAFGHDKYVLMSPSASDIARAGIKALEQEAAKLLDNPAVKEAYDHFMLLCKLTYSEKG